METPSTDFECGPYALVLSITAQTHNIRPPTIDELRAIYQSPDFQEANAEVLMENSNNFTVDQVARVLHEWARENGHSFRLGYVLYGQDPIILDNEDSHDNPVIWIHNNATGITDNNLNHSSGIRMLSSRPNGPFGQKTNTSTGRFEKDEGNDGDADGGDVKKETEIDDDIAGFTYNGPPNKTANAVSVEVEHKQTFSSPLTLMALAAVTHAQAEPRNFGEAMKRHDAQKYLEATREEQASLEKNKVYELVDPKPNMKIISSRLLYKKKYNPDGSVRKYKARLVARGFQQEEGIDYNETFATVVKAASWRALIALAGILGWFIYLMDVKTAFLYGLLQEVIYVRPPPGLDVPKGKILKLLRALYGLKQAPRVWYARPATELEKLGFRVSKFDPCVFIHKQHQLIVAVWVDDLLIFGKYEKTINWFRNIMKDIFEMTDEGKCDYYLGMHVDQRKNGVGIYQTRYAEQILDCFGLNDIAPSATPSDGRYLEAENKEKSPPGFVERFLSMVGSLMWLSNCTRPDICHAVNYVARLISNGPETCGGGG